VTPPEPRPAVLETTVVGPEVTGARSALAALRFYAADAAADARPGRLGAALWGAAQAVHAVGRVVSDRALRRAALVPTALTAIASAALAWLVMEAPAGEDRLAAFHAWVVVFVALASMPPTILRRMWVRVALEARRVAGLAPGEDPHAREGLARMLWREGWKLARQAAVVSFGLLPIVAVVKLLPFGRAESAALAAAWAFYWIVVDAFELPLEVVAGAAPAARAPWYARLLRRAAGAFVLLGFLRGVARLLAALTRPWHEEVEFTERHAWEVAGFALVLGALLAIPGVGLFFRSFAIVAATGMHGRLEER
jgi:hypothetical protein